MTPEEALRNILILVDGSDEVEDVHALHSGYRRRAYNHHSSGSQSSRKRPPQLAACFISNVTGWGFV